MKVQIFCPFGQDTGYGRAAHDYCEAMLSAGIDLDIRPIIDPKLDKLENRYQNLLDYVNRPEADDPAWPDVVIMHATPPGCEKLLEEFVGRDSVPRVALTTWESDPLPEHLAKRISGYDQIWVPSKYCYAVVTRQPNDEWLTHNFDRSTNDVVKVMPHSFDPNFFVYKDYAPYRERKDAKKCYVFYTILTFCERKNPIGLLKAYLTEFGPEDNVLLRIRTPGYNNDDINELVRGLGLKYLPPVEMLCDYLDEAGLLSLHYNSDCYVTCARSEGWGLGAYESAVLGKPVIYTNYSGLKDFLDDTHGCIPIPYFETPAYTPESVSNTEINIAGVRIKPILRNDHTGINGSQTWAEPDLGTLKKQMRNVYEVNLTEGNEAREDLESRYSYTAVGKLIKDTLGELLSRTGV